MDCYFVFILSQQTGNGLHVGMTGNLQGRIASARQLTGDRAAPQLLYYELSNSPEAAFRRKRQIRSWPRQRKRALIGSMNPQWDDLSTKW